MQKMSQNRLASVLMMVILSASLVLLGCTSLPGQRQNNPAKAYLLQAPEDGIEMQVTDAAPCLTLVVNTMRAAPGFTTSRIAYVQKDYQLDYFAHHQWADTPANMLTTIITQALENSYLFRAVVESPVAIKSNLHLNSELLHLRQVFKDDVSTVELQLRVVLTDQETRGVVASHIFSLSEVAPENTPYGGVIAANRVAARLLPELINFVDKATHDHALGCQN